MKKIKRAESYHNFSIVLIPLFLLFCGGLYFFKVSFKPVPLYLWILAFTLPFNALFSAIYCRYLYDKQKQKEDVY